MRHQCRHRWLVAAPRPCRAKFSAGQSVTLLNRFTQQLPGLAGLRGSGLNLGDFRREIMILDRESEPSRIVSAFAVPLPSLLVDALRHLNEHRDVLRAQVEPPVRTVEPEALVVPEPALGILALVPQELGRARNHRP